MTRRLRTLAPAAVLALCFASAYIIYLNGRSVKLHLPLGRHPLSQHAPEATQIPSKAAGVDEPTLPEHSEQLNGTFGSDPGPLINEYLRQIVSLSPEHNGVLPLHDVREGAVDDFYSMHAGAIPVTEEQLRKYVRIDESNTTMLRSLHAEAVAALPRELPSNTWQRGRGIVMTGGGKYFPILLSTLKWLNDRQNDLPIEVILAEGEYERAYCEEVFPTLGAQCVILERVLDVNSLNQFAFMGYPLKVLTILASSFEEVYYMDVDSLPLAPLNPIFEAAPYTKTGYVLFPDYWPRVTLPLFYDVAGLQLIEPSGSKTGDQPVLIHEMEGAIPDFTSTESGQMFVDKTQHFRSLLLALYYNLNGKSYYFSLLNMAENIPGYGDKDSFVAAAHVLSENYYQVRHGAKTLGFPGSDGHFHGHVMGQVDPRDDSNLKVSEVPGTDKDRIPLLSVHTTMFKLNPRSLFGAGGAAVALDSPLVSELRYLGKLTALKEATAPTDAGDIELAMFETVKYAICEWVVAQGRVPASLADLDDDELERLCHEATTHVSWLRENPEAV